MNVLLRAKHWQIFLLTFGIPMLLEFVMMFSIFSSLMHNQDIMNNREMMRPPDPAVIFGYFKFFPFIMVLFMGTLLWWQWSVAMGLQKMVPAGIKMKVKKFKIFFFIPVVYMSLILTFVFYVLSSNIINFNNPESFAPGFFVAFSVIFPLHLFSMFCLFYCLYFIAKTLKTVELQREVSFSDFVLEFFLIWLLPIGVWIIQPKINKIVKDYAAQDGDETPLNG